MRRRDTFDVITSAAAVAADALAVFAGFMLAEWVRFESGLLPAFLTRHFPEPPPSREIYFYGALVGTLLVLLIFRGLGLYVRPQIGPFSEYIPRLTRATGLGILLAMALAFVIRTDPPFSRTTVALSLGTVWLCVMLERALLFRAEIAMARSQAKQHDRIALVGADATAARLRISLESEPRLHARVTAFFRTSEDPVAPGIPAPMVAGSLADLPAWLDREGAEQVVLCDSSVGHDAMVEMMLECERRLVDFRMVPDLFGVLTSAVEMQAVDGVPLLGLRKWPLDYFWNRFWKRTEDLVGAAAGLLICAPAIGIAALLIKRSSPGPVFYRQERCGQSGRSFVIFKLRTMRADAEEETGPVWTTPDDPRRTPVGAWLRRNNIDELPQFWNVLRGEMSLVGPRPERPHFVEKFREDIGLYMRRHVSKPGMTGWAQVNGLRGNTDIRERVKYDLYYLENWSLALDFKILARTFFARRNAY